MSGVTICCQSWIVLTVPQHARLLGMRRLLLLLVLFVTPALAHPGWGIVVAPDGTVFCTDLHQVWRLTPTGQLSVAVPHVHSHELTMDAAGNLYGENVEYQAAGEKWW